MKFESVFSPNFILYITVIVLNKGYFRVDVPNLQRKMTTFVHHCYIDTFITLLHFCHFLRPQSLSPFVFSVVSETLIVFDRYLRTITNIAIFFLLHRSCTKPSAFALYSVCEYLFLNKCF